MRVCSSRSLSLLRTSARVFPRVRAVEHGLACLCECARLRACLSVLQDEKVESQKVESVRNRLAPLTVVVVPRPTTPFSETTELYLFEESCVRKPDAT